MPDRLYGRDREIARLFGSFERVCRGQGEVLLVPGDSGVGKTTLVRQLRTTIRDRNGFFIQGKFEQYQRNSPYFAFRQALAELCLELKSENEQQRKRWAADILDVIGGLGRLLVDLVPEFESLLGPQPPLGGISPQEARHRLVVFFQNFLKAFCRPEHPLVIFIDDWQWADPASLELLKQLRIGTSLRYILVIASYRDGEVGPDHPLVPTLDAMRSRSVPVEVLQVGDITIDDVLAFASDTLKPEVRDLGGFAAFLHGATSGNPFFTRLFLGFMHEFGLLWFDAGRDRWEWQTVKAGDARLPGTAVELFSHKLGHLDADARGLFAFAACLGNRFDLETLGIISGRAPGDCLVLLSSGQAKSLLLPLDKDWEGGGFAFLHDQVQRAAYSLIDPAGLPAIRLKIGRLLLAGLGPERLAESLFEVVGDLNAGSDLIQDADEQMRMVALNIAAARKVYAAAAYHSALQCYQAASRFLEKPGFAQRLWRDDHDMAMSLFKERADCEFLEGSRAEGERCVREAVSHAGTAVAKAEALNVLILHYTLLARYPDAIAVGRQALAMLGIDLPEEGYEDARDGEIGRFWRELGDRPVSSLADLPVMVDPVMLMASKILIAMGPPCYRSHQRLWAVIVPKVVNLTLRHGNIPQVGYSHPAFGGLLGWAEDDYSTAREFGDLATSLMTRTFLSPSDQSVFYLMVGSSIRHWFSHLKHSTQDYTDAFEIGLRSGNLQYAAYAFGHNMYCRFYQGVPLEALKQETRRSLDFSRTRINQWAIDLLEGGLAVFGSLSDDSPGPAGRGSRREEEYLRRVEEHRNIQVACIYKILRAFSLLVLGDHYRALALSDEAEALIHTVGTQGLLPWPEHVSARVMILAALYPAADGARRAEWREEIGRMMERLGVWAGNCPENFAHKHLLAGAELARMEGRTMDAARLYGEAADAARVGDFLQWEAIANERASGLWRESGNGRLAQERWRSAYVCYSRWGATTKLRLMDMEYRADLEASLPADAAERGIGQALVDRQVGEFRRDVARILEAEAMTDTAAKVEELAGATERLRLEIAERKRAEAALEKALERNRDLLLEIQHRVKNSFAMISGMIGIATNSTASNDGKTALEELDSRVRSVAALYSLLNSSGSFTEVRLDDYCDRVAAPLVGMAGNITLETGMESMAVSVRIATPIGLILTELVTNAMKYAFPGGRRGTIEVRLGKTGGGAILEVRDDGIGLPEGFDPSGNAGMGLNLVQGLVKQIGGAFRMEGGAAGTRCVLEFAREVAL
jgi:predicted ATPase/two-component sensor histidine kinase